MSDTRNEASFGLKEGKCRKTNNKDTKKIPNTEWEKQEEDNDNDEKEEEEERKRNGETQWERRTITTLLQQS